VACGAKFLIASKRVASGEESVRHVLGVSRRVAGTAASPSSIVSTTSTSTSSSRSASTAASTSRPEKRSKPHARRESGRVIQRFPASTPRRGSQRSRAGWRRRKKLLERWIRTNGYTCPGYQRPPHEAV
jgi:hypothetical protein